MTGCAKQVAFVLDSSSMRVVAIGALDVLVIHLALNERAINIDFVEYLAVGVIGLFADQFTREVILEILASVIALTKDASS